MAASEETGARLHSVQKAGEEFTRRVAKALNKDSWLWSTVGLAWTAGPVTYLAVWGGSYVGYGETPTGQTFIYFAAYTLIAGLFSVVSRFIRNVLVAPKVQAAERDLLCAVDRMFLLYFSARNEYLKTYPSEEHYRIFAWTVFRTAASNADTLSEAVYRLVPEGPLHHLIRRVEYYRRQGFNDLISTEYTQYEKELAALYAETSGQFPALAGLLERRFKGDAPSIGFGQPRPSGFIERLIAADEQRKYALATGDDVLSTIQLTIELLCGRVIIALMPEFKGHKQLEEARQRMEALMSDFRLARRKRNGRMWALLEDLDMEGESEAIQGAGASSQELQDLLLRAIKKRTHESLGSRRYDEILQLNERLRKIWVRLAQSERAYNRIWQRDGKRLQKRLRDAVAPDKRSSPLRISEHEITLSNDQKILFARAIHEVLDGIMIRKRSLLGLRQEDGDQVPLELDDYKQLSIEMVNALDELLNISEREEQLAIEGSREADFGCIEPGLAAQTKIGWSRVMVEEVQQDRVQIAHHLAHSLVEYLNLSLGEATITYLVEEYGASREYLEQLQAEGAEKVTVASAELRPDILKLPRWSDIRRKPRGWRLR